MENVPLIMKQYMQLSMTLFIKRNAVREVMKNVK